MLIMPDHDKLTAIAETYLFVVYFFFLIDSYFISLFVLFTLTCLCIHVVVWP